MVTYEELVIQTRELCSNVLDNNPAERGNIRRKFYKDYGRKVAGGEKYGRAEIAYYQWEENRGSMNPLDDITLPGSPWWRNVNLKFIYFSELAGAMFENNITSDKAPNPVHKWLDFLKNPSPKSWYRAHNASIFTAAEEFRKNSSEENDISAWFLNPVLYRLMFAQAILEEPTFATAAVETGINNISDEIKNEFLKNLIEKIEKELEKKYTGDLIKDLEYFADPRGPGVSIILNFQNFYPTEYPIQNNKKNKNILTGNINAFNLLTSRSKWFKAEEVNVFDNHIIAPQIDKLYGFIDQWNDLDFVSSWQTHGKPTYDLREINS